MALIRYKTTRKGHAISIEKAIQIWLAKNHEIEVTPDQQAYADTVDDLSWDIEKYKDITPLSYLRAHQLGSVAKARDKGFRLPELSQPYPDRLMAASQSIDKD